MSAGYTDKKFAIHRKVEELLYSLLTGTNKQIGVYLFGLINALPVDLEDELFSFDPDKKRRKTFSLDISYLFPQHRDKFEIEVYVVERFLEKYHTGTFLENIVFAVKILKLPGYSYRLFFMLDKELHIVVYLHLELRPYDIDDSEWTKEINNAMFNYILVERQRIINNENPTGDWTWI